MNDNILTRANVINVLSDYLGMRDVAQLTPTSLKAKYGFAQADLCVLYGGSILAGGDVLASTIKSVLPNTMLSPAGMATPPSFCVTK